MHPHSPSRCTLNRVEFFTPAIQSSNFSEPSNRFFQPCDRSKILIEGRGQDRGRPSMLYKLRRVAIVGAATIVPLAFVTIATPGVSSAIECGFGTVFDQPSNS